LKGNIMLEVVYVLAFFAFQTTMVELKRYDNMNECRVVAEQLKKLTTEQTTNGRFLCLIFPK